MLIAKLYTHCPMWISWLFATLVGIAIVVQSALNREISLVSGLSAVLFVNCLLTVLFSTLLLVVVLWKPQLFPDFVRIQSGNNWITIKHVLAGLCGFCIIFGMPIAMNKLGALKTLALIIAVQLIVALLWDGIKEGIPISFQRIVGALITFLGALFTLMS